MIADEGCWERGCACYDSRDKDSKGVEVILKGEKHMIDVHKLQCYTTAARLRGYADAMQDEGNYSALCATLSKAADLLEKEWDNYQKEMNARRNPTDN